MDGSLRMTDRPAYCYSCNVDKALENYSGLAQAQTVLTKSRRLQSGFLAGRVDGVSANRLMSRTRVCRVHEGEHVFVFFLYGYLQITN